MTRDISFDRNSCLPPLDIPHTLMIVPIESPTTRSLFSKQPAHPPQDTVLLRVIGVIFARYFKDGWEGGGVGIDAVAYAVGDLEWEDKVRHMLMSLVRGKCNLRVGLSG